MNDLYLNKMEIRIGQPDLGVLFLQQIVCKYCLAHNSYTEIDRDLQDSKNLNYDPSVPLVSFYMK